jgi:hypothetical protein
MIIAITTVLASKKCTCILITRNTKGGSITVLFTSCLNGLD